MKLKFPILTLGFAWSFSLVPCILPTCVQAQGSSASFQAYSHHTSAVDANDVHHEGDDYPGNPPWLEDQLKSVAPEYPYSERLNKHQGRAIVRLTLDLKTGIVTKAVVVKSSGFDALDHCAVVSFRQWTWKPGKWKEIDLPVTFRMGPAAPIPRGISILPAHH